MVVFFLVCVVSCKSWQKSRNVPKKAFLWLQGHPRSWNLWWIERTSVTSCQWITVTLAISRMVLQLQWLIVWKVAFQTVVPLCHFNALIKHVPLPISSTEPFAMTPLLFLFLSCPRYRRHCWNLPRQLFPAFPFGCRNDASTEFCIE